MSSHQAPGQRHQLRVGDSPWVKGLLIGFTLFLTVILLVVPLIAIFQQAFVEGAAHYFNSLLEADTLHAIGLTLVVAALTVPINLVFGVMLAWSVTRLDGHSFCRLARRGGFTVSVAVRQQRLDWLVAL